MQKKFFTADLHFGHENAIRFDNRPFANVDEMDAELIRRWNAKVDKGDLVYVLGDMFWKTRDGAAADIIKNLNGQIILIKGNHDRFVKQAKAKKALACVKESDTISVTLENGNTYRCFLSHHFTPFYDGHRNGAIHLHGHSHITEEHLHELEITQMLREKGYNPLIINVGCMHWNYEPVTLDEILAKYHFDLANSEQVNAESKTTEELEALEREENALIDKVAADVLERYRHAFEELAKGDNCDESSDKEIVEDIPSPSVKGGRIAQC